jgi:hypothetical protein
MCNCGNKRQSLNTRQQSFTYPVPDKAVENAQSFGNQTSAHIKFNYTGSRSLFIKSKAGGQIYKFSPAQPVWTVNIDDIEMMHRFNDLHEIKQSS